MEETQHPKDISFTVIDGTLDDSKLAQQAIIITQDKGEGIVFETGVVPFLMIDKKGVRGHGSTFKLDSIKYFDATPTDAVANQVNGYLSVLNVTEGNPVSILVVESSNDAPLNDVIMGVSEIYKGRYMAENRERLKKESTEVGKKLHQEAYNWLSLSGLMRRLRNSSVTAYFSGPNHLMEKAASVTHPGQKYNLSEYKRA